MSVDAKSALEHLGAAIRGTLPEYKRRLHVDRMNAVDAAGAHGVAFGSRRFVHELDVSARVLEDAVAEWRRLAADVLSLVTSSAELPTAEALAGLISTVARAEFDEIASDLESRAAMGGAPVLATARSAISEFTLRGQHGEEATLPAMQRAVIDRANRLKADEAAERAQQFSNRVAGASFLISVVALAISIATGK